MKERDTAIIPARVKKTKIELIRDRAAKKGISVNAWLNWAINNALRKHGQTTPDASHGANPDA